MTTAATPRARVLRLVDVVAVAATGLLGAAHLAATPFLHAGRTVGAMWFVAPGVVLVLLSLIGFARLASREAAVAWIAAAGSTVAAAFAALAVAALGTTQAAVALMLTVGQTLASVLAARHRTRRSS